MKKEIIGIGIILALLISLIGVGSAYPVTYRDGNCIITIDEEKGTIYVQQYQTPLDKFLAFFSVASGTGCYDYYNCRRVREWEQAGVGYIIEVECWCKDDSTRPGQRVQTQVIEYDWDWICTAMEKVCPQHICTPFNLQCNEDILTQCKPDGMAWITLEICEFGCAHGACKAPPQICTPNERRCVGDVLEGCKQDGSVWATIETCTYGCSGSACNSPPAQPTPTPTPTATPSPTASPSPSPTPTPENGTPGFGAVTGIVGILVASCFFIFGRRREKRG